MEEKLVSLKTAVLAKEKGFGKWSGDIKTTWYCRAKYFHKRPCGIGVNWHENKVVYSSSYDLNNVTVYPKCEVFTYAPTQHSLQKWLRDVHNIHANVSVNFYNKKPKLGYYYILDRFDKNDIHDGMTYDDSQYEILGEKKGFDSYEEALEAVLQLALNLIDTQ